MMNYIYVIIAALLLPFDFSISKKYQSVEGTSMAAGLKYNALNGLFTALIFWGLTGFSVKFSGFSMIMAFSMALFCAAYSIIGFKILKAGSLGMYSLFLMSGGMLLPYLFGVTFLKESLTVFRIFGVILILAAIVIANRTKQKVDKWQLILCLVIFALNGMVGIVSKCHQINVTYNTVDSTMFVMYTGILRFFMSAATLAFVKEEKKVSFGYPKKVLPMIAASAMISGLSYMLQLVGAKDLPASVLYPIVTGGSIVFSTIVGRVFFKEKPAVVQIAGTILCFVGTCMFL